MYDISSLYHVKIYWISKNYKVVILGVVDTGQAEQSINKIKFWKEPVGSL